MRLVVVGNAEPKTDHSEFIDGCDTVIRFNLTPFYETGLTGFRTTVLCLYGLPEPPKEMPGLNTSVVRTCLTMWVGSPVFFARLWETYKVPRERIIPKDLSGVYDNHATPLDAPIKRPSSGFQVLRYLVNAREFSGVRKFICGFGFEGGPCHSWEQERSQVDRYRSSGLLQTLF